MCVTCPFSWRRPSYSCWSVSYCFFCIELVLGVDDTWKVKRCWPAKAKVKDAQLSASWPPCFWEWDWRSCFYDCPTLSCTKSTATARSSGMNRAPASLSLFTYCSKPAIYYWSPITRRTSFSTACAAPYFVGKLCNCFVTWAVVGQCQHRFTALRFHWKTFDELIGWWHDSLMMTVVSYSSISARLRINYLVTMRMWASVFCFLFTIVLITSYL